MKPLSSAPLGLLSTGATTDVGSTVVGPVMVLMTPVMVIIDPDSVPDPGRRVVIAPVMVNMLPAPGSTTVVSVTGPVMVLMGPVMVMIDPESVPDPVVTVVPVTMAVICPVMVIMLPLAELVGLMGPGPVGDDDDDDPETDDVVLSELGVEVGGGVEVVVDDTALPQTTAGAVGGSVLMLLKPSILMDPSVALKLTSYLVVLT